MLTYRSFRNTDPPILTALWRSRAGQRGLREPVSADLFEQLVFAKLYFDYAGLIIATEDGRPVGFAHAGFGPNENENAVTTELGVTCLMIVRPDCATAEVAAGLLEHCEHYLRRRGAKVLYGGGIRPLNPFYVGLYGGSEVPGVLKTDLVAREAYAAHGYHEIDQTGIFQINLTGFQADLDRQQMQVRRQMLVEVTLDCPTRTWWEACTIGEFDLTRFELVSRSGGQPVARALFRDMDPSETLAGGRRAGLIDMEVDDAFRGRGLSVFLLSEAFRQFLRQGITTVEAQTPQHNVAAMKVYRRLGFQQVDEGSVFRKQE